MLLEMRLLVANDIVFTERTAKSRKSYIVLHPLKTCEREPQLEIERTRRLLSVNHFELYRHQATYVSKIEQCQNALLIMSTLGEDSSPGLLPTLAAIPSN